MNEENTNIEVNHENLQKALALLAWKHDEVREELVKNPKAAIEKHLGVKLNDDIKVNVVSHTDPKELTFILPCDYHKVTDNELSDEDLEKAAGGILEMVTVPLFNAIGDGLMALGLPATGMSGTIGKIAGSAGESAIGFGIKSLLT